MTDSCRRVGAESVMRVHEPLRLMLQVSVSGMAPTRLEESVQASCAGVPLGVTEVQLPGEGRVHLADPQPGMVTVTYDATIRGTAHSAAVTEADRISYLRPSRTGWHRSLRLPAISAGRLRRVLSLARAEHAIDHPTIPPRGASLAGKGHM